MDINDNIISPLELKISFSKLLEQYEAMAESDDPVTAAKANELLKIANDYPELREGFSDLSILTIREHSVHCYRKMK